MSLLGPTQLRTDLEKAAMKENNSASKHFFFRPEL